MINQVVLVGRLTKDPDLRYTSSGSAVASFTLAVNRNFTNQSGNREADFINCVIWRKPAEAVANYAHKGTLIGVVGRIQTRSYENQQGQRVYVTEVVCENFPLLESRATQGHQDGVSEQQEKRDGVSYGFEGEYTKEESEPLKTDVNSQNRQEAFFDSSNPFNGNGSHIDISDDDLPF